MIDVDRLENVKRRGGKITARCPACAEQGADKSGEHLVILDDGKFGCIANPGPGGHAHRRRIAELVGSPNEPRPLRTTPRATPKPPPKPRPGRMDAETARIWNEGVDHLVSNADLCAEIDTWRGYQPGTVATLAEGGVMGAPVVYGRRTVAFVVADRDGLEIGFHARHYPKEGERAKWSFHPTGTPALPFVLGGGFARHARRVLLSEGQWDCLAAASALGWLAHDTAWDEHTVFLGTRGASGFSSVLSEWLHAIPETSEWFLYRDADKAGESWKGYAEQLREHGRKVHLRRPAKGKDLNDVLRGRTIDAEDILQ